MAAAPGAQDVKHTPFPSPALWTLQTSVSQCGTLCIAAPAWFWKNFWSPCSPCYPNTDVAELNRTMRVLLQRGLCIDTHQVRRREGVFNYHHPHPPGREDFLIQHRLQEQLHHTIQSLPLSPWQLKYFVNIYFDSQDLTLLLHTWSPLEKVFGGHLLLVLPTKARQGKARILCLDSL